MGAKFQSAFTGRSLTGRRPRTFVRSARRVHVTRSCDTRGVPEEADDVLGLKQRPGSWYEVPQHTTIKYSDVQRKFHDTILSLPGAGDFGNDEKHIEIALPMVTNAGVARVIV